MPRQEPLSLDCHAKTPLAPEGAAIGSWWVPA